MAHRCPATVRGKTYASVQDAAAANGRTVRQAHRHLLKYGHLDYLGVKPPRERPDARKSVKVAHLEFDSLTAAAQALGVDRKTITNASKREASKTFLMQAVMRYTRKQEQEDERRRFNATRYGGKWARHGAG